MTLAVKLVTTLLGRPRNSVLSMRAVSSYATQDVKTRGVLIDHHIIVFTVSRLSQHSSTSDGSHASAATSNLAAEESLNHLSKAHLARHFTPSRRWLQHVAPLGCPRRRRLRPALCAPFRHRALLPPHTRPPRLASAPTRPPRCPLADLTTTSLKVMGNFHFT